MKTQVLGVKHGEHNYQYGISYKWINDGKHSRHLYDDEELPEGWSFGRFLSPQARKGISDAAKTQTFSEETRKKMSAKAKGRKFTEEHKKKISEALKGNRVNVHWYNNGQHNILAKECPIGFKEGRL